MPPNRCTHSRSISEIPSLFLTRGQTSRAIVATTEKKGSSSHTLRLPPPKIITIIILIKARFDPNGVQPCLFVFVSGFMTKRIENPHENIGQKLSFFVRAGWAAVKGCFQPGPQLFIPSPPNTPVRQGPGHHTVPVRCANPMPF